MREVPSVVAVVFAEVELDPDTGIAQVLRLALAPVGVAASPLGSWEDGQLAAALPLVFGGKAAPTALDVPTIEHVGESAAQGASIPPLADLVPAAAAALAHALSAATGSPVRELPVRPETLIAPAQKTWS